MVWRDRLPKAPLDPQEIKRQSGVSDWTTHLAGVQAELPEPFAVIDVLEGEGCKETCIDLRAIRRNPRIVRRAEIDTKPGRTWNINPILNQIAQEAAPGFALDLGCGAGRDAVWLAANDWDVTAVDRLASNIEAIQRLAKTYAPDKPIEAIQANLHDYRPETQYDLVLLHYCWDPNYFELAKQSTARGGFLSVLGHSETNYRCFAHPRESKLINSKALDCEGFETWSEREFWSRDRHSVSIVLRRH